MKRKAFLIGEVLKTIRTKDYRS